MCLLAMFLSCYAKYQDIMRRDRVLLFSERDSGGQTKIYMFWKSGRYNCRLIVCLRVAQEAVFDS
jgi:hypothetical protein